MATNICSRTRTKYSTVKELAEELGCCVQQVYKTLKRPEMEQAKKKIGTAGVRIDKEEFYRIMEQIYRWKVGEHTWAKEKDKHTEKDK